jgi:hypothetical protein
LSARRHRTESGLAGIVGLACVAFGLRWALGRRDHARLVAEPAAAPAGPADHADSFATGCQTLLAIIQGVVFGTLTITGQNALYHHGTVAQHLITSGQVITTFTVIVAVTDQYLKLVRAAQWSPTALDTAVPYLLGLGQVAMATSLGSEVRWWASAAILPLLSAWAFIYTRTRAGSGEFAGGNQHRRAFVSTVTAYSIASALLLICEAAMCALSSVTARPAWLLIAAPFATFPLYALVFKISRKAIKKRYRKARAHAASVVG